MLLVDSDGTQERWVGTDWWLFWSFALGMLLENYIFSLAPIATGWIKNLPTSLTALMLAWAPIWLIIGIAVAGPVSDRMGRKGTFYLTMALYAVGGIGLILSAGYVSILVFLAVLLFAAGGEMNTIMAASHEMMPARHRGKAMMMELNFINLGGFLLGILSIASKSWSSSEGLQKASLGIAILLVLVVLVLARLRTPESLRWLHRKGRDDRMHLEAVRFYGPLQGEVRVQEVRRPANRVSRSLVTRRGPGLGTRLFVTMATAFAGSAGFGLMTYTLGPLFFKGLVAQIILVAAGVGFFSGFFGLYADRLSRKWLLLAGYLGAFLVTVVIYLTVGAWSRTLALFWILLVVLNLFTNVSYLTEDTLKGEVWPTERRGTYTALVRFVSIGLYIPTIYLSSVLNLHQTMLFNMLIWAVGLTGAVWWMVRGVETGAGVRIDDASGGEST